MADIRSFTAAWRERTRGRTSIQFEIAGETLEAVPVPAAGNVVDLMAGGSDAVAYRRFLRSVLRDDDATEERASSRDRFDELQYRSVDAIDADVIIEVVEWLAGEYAARPTGRSSDLSDGPLSDGEPSSNGSSSPVETPESSST